MKNIIRVSLFSALTIFATNLYASKPTYICKADLAAGFGMSQYSGWQGFSERDSTEFRVHFDELSGWEAQIKTESGWSYWTAMKEHSSVYWTDTGSLGFHQFTFAVKRLKFHAAYTGGYLNGTDKTMFL